MENKVFILRVYSATTPTQSMAAYGEPQIKIEKNRDNKYQQNRNLTATHLQGTRPIISRGLENTTQL